MSKDPASQAEGLNYAERNGEALEHRQGSGPELFASIRVSASAKDAVWWGKGARKRKRAFYRAKKRGEPWVLFQEQLARGVRVMEQALFASHLPTIKPESKGLREILNFDGPLWKPRPKPPEDCF
jgi:hypothetical protein